jgi:peptidoglycan hydrolase-like protein with peptidoglycan-binding domain
MKTEPNPHRYRSKAIRRAIFTVLGVAALLGGVVGARAGLDRLRDEDAVDLAAAETNVATADIRDLTETYTATGTLQYDEAIEITVPTGGTVLDIVEAGTTLDNGDIIAVVDDRMIVWLDGEIPAWRTLSVGDEGVDVLQLEAALAALGFNGDDDVTIDEEYTAETSSMVEDWQASIGIEPTGRVDLGAVVFGGARTRVASAAVAVGDNVSDGAALIALGTNNRNALLDAAPGEAITLAVGDAAAIELPDRTDVAGTIAAIAAGSETWQITVVFTDTTGFPATDVTNVEMSWTHNIAGGVLTVPSSSLLRLDNGTYTVDVVNDDGSITATPVTVGVAVGTRVEIVNGLNQGDAVVSL